MRWCFFLHQIIEVPTKLKIQIACISKVQVSQVWSSQIIVLYSSKYQFGTDCAPGQERLYVQKTETTWKSSRISGSRTQLIRLGFGPRIEKWTLILRKRARISETHVLFFFFLVKIQNTETIKEQTRRHEKITLNIQRSQFQTIVQFNANKVYSQAKVI